MTIRWASSQLKTPMGMWAAAGVQAVAMIGAVLAVFAVVRIPEDDPSHTVFLQIGLVMIVLFGPWGLWLHFRTRARVVVREERGVVHLEVTMPQQTSISYTGPFRVTRGQCERFVHTGRTRVRQTEIHVAVRQEKSGERVLLLTHVMGAAYEPPAGWETRDASHGPFRHVLTTTFGRANIEQLPAALTRE